MCSVSIFVAGYSQQPDLYLGYGQPQDAPPLYTFEYPEGVAAAAHQPMNSYNSEKKQASNGMCCFCDVIYPCAQSCPGCRITPKLLYVLAQHRAAFYLLSCTAAALLVLCRLV
jgi:hypothetical protein